jgi:hypothetical protein
MLQMLNLDVSKIDIDFAHVTMATHAYFKHMFQVFHLFQTYVANVSSRCFKSRLGVAGCRPPTVAKAPPWFVCGCLRWQTPPRRTSAGGAGGRGVVVLPCGHGMGAGHGSTMQAQDARAARFRTLALDVNRTGHMRCSAGMGEGATSGREPGARRPGTSLTAAQILAPIFFLSTMKTHLVPLSLISFFIRTT